MILTNWDDFTELITDNNNILIRIFSFIRQSNINIKKLAISIIANITRAFF